MIKFFRKIRQQLLSDNKFSKYLIYALGEIILVVIGILIALQINNWNEHKKQSNNALLLCEQLLEETKNNIEILKTDIKRNEDLLTAHLRVLNMMGEDYKNKDTNQLDSLMSSVFVVPKLLIKSSVLDQALSDNEFTKNVEQKLVTKMYDLPVLIERIISTEKSAVRYTNEQLFPILTKNYSVRNMDSKFSPSMKGVGLSKFNKDSRKVLAVFSFENVLDNKYFLVNSFNNYVKTLLDEFETLSELLTTNINTVK